MIEIGIDAQKRFPIIIKVDTKAVSAKDMATILYYLSRGAYEPVLSQYLESMLDAEDRKEVLQYYNELYNYETAQKLKAASTPIIKN